MKPHAEIDEGPEAYARFTEAMKKVIAVPHSVIMERIEAEKRKSAAKQVRPGPKPKSNPAS